MREGISKPPITSSRSVWSGVAMVIVGLSVLLLVGEWFAMYDACVASPGCSTEVPVSILESCLGLLVERNRFHGGRLTGALNRGRGQP